MTVVETYLQDELKDLIHDEDQVKEWTETVRALGLDGQEGLQNPDCTPVPFIHMKPVLKTMFETLCPEQRTVKKYKLTPIPLEGLKLISLAQKERYFTDIYVWYDDKAPDPILVGERKTLYWMKENEYSRIEGCPDFVHQDEAEAWLSDQDLPRNDYKLPTWSDGELYLMARWGDEKRPLEELHKMAVDRYRAEKSVQYIEQQKAAQRGLDDLEEDILKKFGVAL